MFSREHVHVVVLQRTHRNLRRFITHVHSHCSTHETRCLLTFPLRGFLKLPNVSAALFSGFLLKQAFLSRIDFISEWTFVYFLHFSDPAIQN